MKKKYKENPEQKKNMKKTNIQTIPNKKEKLKKM